MKLSLALAATFAVAQAMDHASTLISENEVSSFSSAVPSPRSSSVQDYGFEGAWGNDIDDKDDINYPEYNGFLQDLPSYPGISAPKNDFPFDIVSLIFHGMTPEEVKRLNLTDAQKLWYVGVLDGLIKRRPGAKIPDDINDAIYAGMDEETKQNLGLTEEQNKWFAEVIKDITDVESNQDALHLHDMKQDKPEYPLYKSIYEDFEKFYGLNSSTSEPPRVGDFIVSKSFGIVDRPPAATVLSPNHLHNLAITGPTSALKTSISTSSGNTTVAAASGARAIKETWAMLGGVILGAILVTF